VARCWEEEGRLALLISPHCLQFSDCKKLDELLKLILSRIVLWLGASGLHQHALDWLRPPAVLHAGRISCVRAASIHMGPSACESWYPVTGGLLSVAKYVVESPSSTSSNGSCPLTPLPVKVGLTSSGTVQSSTIYDLGDTVVVAYSKQREECRKVVAVKA
jgi:hypothetical protein